MGTYTTNLALYKPTVGETGWGTLVNTNWDLLDAASLTTLLRGTLSGCQLSNNGGAPNTKIDISAGVAQDSANAGTMVVTAIIKDISAVWAVGTNGGGRGTSVSLTANTWYHVFVIKRTDTGVVDAYFDTSVSAANIPSPYTWFRRVGSVKTNGSSNLIAFIQDGMYFRWQASVLDLNTTNPGTAAVTATLASVPTNVNVQALLNVGLMDGTSGTALYVSDLAANDESPVISNGSATPAVPGQTLSNPVANASVSSQISVRTNTSAQVRYRLSSSDGSVKVYFVTLGWTDTCGRFA